ncbi:MAG: FkbM family methyltransferase [Gemmatimonadota bacterium]|nr:FkbM family methyltransferase [Gemmatimonadota bacterium]MDQ3606274.1 FkbM family methyltransferase [Gemmatimonadota bacterium]
MSAAPSAAAVASAAGWNPQFAAKLLRLRRAVRNWPRTLLDHLRLSTADYICHLRDGSSFEVRGGTDDRHVIFELAVQQIYPVAITPGDVVIDVGAHIGCFTVMAARRGARVLSFEPVPTNFARLQRNVERNGIEGALLFPVALSERREEREIFLPDDRSHSGRFSLHLGRGGETLRISCLSLDEVVEEHAVERIDLLKLDCQGSEYEILYGASESTLDRVQAIAVECEHFAEPAEWSVDGLKRYLESRGFSARVTGRILIARRERSRGS